MVESDWPEVASIYQAGIATGHATFEAVPPANWAAFITCKRSELSLVALDSADRVNGWVAAAPTSTRTAYAGVVEHSIYIHPDAAGQGVGSRLLAAFLAVADHAGIWTVQSSIFPDNTASLRLHERAGFRTVGRRERIARMDYGPHAGRWRDTILVERRTPADPAGSHAEAASSVNMHTHTCSSDLSTRIFTPNRLQDSSTCGEFRRRANLCRTVRARRSAVAPGRRNCAP